MGRHFFWYHSREVTDERLMEMFEALCEMRVKLAEWKGRQSDLDARVQVMVTRKETEHPSFCPQKLWELEAMAEFNRHKIDSLSANIKAEEVRLVAMKRFKKEKDTAQ